MADDPIMCFDGTEFAFLSNFFSHSIEIDGDIYPTNDHAFQALKTHDPAERKKVREAESASSAKSLGRDVKERTDWDTLQFDIMDSLVRKKFSDPELAAKLLATGNRELIHGNTYRDTTWGYVRGKDGEWKGFNELGKILMQVRDEIR